jgi:hypothetical protein
MSIDDGAADASADVMQAGAVFVNFAGLAEVVGEMFFESAAPGLFRDSGYKKTPAGDWRAF